MPLGERTLIHGKGKPAIIISAGHITEDITAGDSQFIVNLENSATHENNVRPELSENDVAFV